MDVQDAASASEPAVQGISILPDRLLIKIFSYLKTKDSFRNVAVVSKKFHKLSQDLGAHVSANYKSMMY